MILNNGGNKLFLLSKSIDTNPFPAKVVESKIVKIKGHNFTGVYPSPVLMKLFISVEKRANMSMGLDFLCTRT